MLHLRVEYQVPFCWPVNQLDEWNWPEINVRLLLTCNEERLQAKTGNVIVGEQHTENRRKYFISPNFVDTLFPTMLGTVTSELTKELLVLEKKETPLNMWRSVDTLLNWLPITEHNWCSNEHQARFSCWCFNWIEVKRERRWPFQWPLSMEPCLEHNLMNDPGVRGWSGQPCLTPWTHQPTRPFKMIWNLLSKDC